MHIIQSFINAKQYRRYLEIGVSQGDNFLLIRTAHKTAVDPRFQVPWPRWIRTVLRHPRELRNRYFEMTSDEYFDKDAANLQQHGLDIVFVDGAHEYKQCHRDIINALRYLHSDGVILVHDCNPPSANAARSWEEFTAARQRKQQGWTAEWCGDVWKAMARLRSERPDLGACVLDCDYGVGVVRLFPLPQPTPPTPFSVSDIEAMSYEDFVKHRALLIGLRPASDLGTLLAAVGASRATD